MSSVTSGVTSLITGSTTGGVFRSPCSNASSAEKSSATTLAVAAGGCGTVGGGGSTTAARVRSHVAPDGVASRVRPEPSHCAVPARQWRANRRHRNQNRDRIAAPRIRGRRGRGELDVEDAHLLRELQALCLLRGPGLVVFGEPLVVNLENRRRFPRASAGNCKPGSCKSSAISRLPARASARAWLSAVPNQSSSTSKTGLPAALLVTDGGRPGDRGSAAPEAGPIGPAGLRGAGAPGARPDNC